MAKLGTHILLDGKVIPSDEARVPITSSSVLYGLSVYSVFFAKYLNGSLYGFRVPEHLQRLKQSGRMIGFTDTDLLIDEETCHTYINQLIEANKPTTDQFFRITVHATETLPGVRTSNLKLTFSMFMYEAENILPQDKARLKTSLWRRTADTAIPARAKVNGAYVNSALAKQDALDSGFDDCLFLNQNGYVSELSAANIFMVKRGQLITPDCASDILEGITRRSIIEIATEQGIPVTERKVALTELYTADEVFACGTSAFISPIVEIDRRIINGNVAGKTTLNLRDKLTQIQRDINHPWVTAL